jgi:crotonobetainyl-CoA:carnitine CoA-transferase CaiB-like acyl-CoA transferase
MSTPWPDALPPVVVAGEAPVVDAAARLLDDLGLQVVRESASGPAPAADLGLAWSDGGSPVGIDDGPAAAAWAWSGAMALTGEADGAPELVPSATVDAVRVLGPVLSALTDRLAVSGWGRRVDVDALALLGERAAIAGFGRGGATSVGGNAHLLAAADGWLALNLGRPEDLALLPAWLEAPLDPADWRAVTAAVAVRPVEALVEQAALLGLPVGAVPAGRRDAQLVVRHADRRVRPAVVTPGGPARHGGAPLVVDLSSLWAGPLCTRLLAAAGARVVKVEGARRADGARRGPAAFFDLLHVGKEAVTVDFADPDDLRFLRALVSRADVVVEASRPRVLDALGFDPSAAADAGTVWLSVTGYGRSGPWANRVAFGDDAAVAGGLVLPAAAGRPPRFVADAVADPLGGVHGALAVLVALLARRGAVVDLALRDTAAACAAEAPPAEGLVVADAAGGHLVRGGGVRAGWEAPVRPPQAPAPPGRAPAAGAHDAAVRREVLGEGSDARS